MICNIYNKRIWIIICILIVLQLLSQHDFTYKTDDNPEHLVVLQHGLNCQQIFVLPYYYKLIKHIKQESTKSYIIHIGNSNSKSMIFSFFYHTNKGIKHASINLANEIYSMVNKYPSINKISLIGSSLGGLYIIYASDILNNNSTYNINGNSFFNSIKGMNLITLAAPHLGIHDWVPIIFEFTPSMNELFNIDNDNIIEYISNMDIIYEYNNTLIMFNCYWDGLVSCKSGAKDVNNIECNKCRNICNDNQSIQSNNIIMEYDVNSTIKYVPVCLNQNWFNIVFSHVLLGGILDDTINAHVNSYF